MADDVFVTSGSQQAVDLIVRVLLEPGDRVAVEDPGYRPVHGAFIAHRAQVVGVPVDAEGLVTDALPDDARLVYVTPSHQYPLGVAMSLRRRLALLAWAERTDAAIIEDDSDSEYRCSGRPREPLHSLDHTGRVLYVGSFSRVLLPTLRLGFVVALPPLHDALRKAKHVTDWHTQVPLQAAAARFRRGGAPRPARPAHAGGLRPATRDDRGCARRPARGAPPRDPDRAHRRGPAAPRTLPAER